jgi:hypothetical protein
MQSLAEQYETKGYTVLRGLLSPEESQHYREVLQRLSGRTDADWQRKWGLNDGLNKCPEFQPLAFNERLLATVRDMLGTPIRFVQHSDLLVHRPTPRFHRDNENRRFGTGYEWTDKSTPFKAVRCAVYLQSYAESGAELGLVPGSHKFEADLPFVARYFHIGVNKILYSVVPELKSRPLPVMVQTDPNGSRLTYTAPEWIRTEPGDCVIFDPRVYHSANYLRGPKYAIFFSYGADDIHCRRYTSYYLHRRPELEYRPLADDFAKALKEADLYLDMDPAEEFPNDVATPAKKIAAAY